MTWVDSYILGNTEYKPKQSSQDTLKVRPTRNNCTILYFPFSRFSNAVRMQSFVLACISPQKNSKGSIKFLEENISLHDNLPKPKYDLRKQEQINKLHSQTKFNFITDNCPIENGNHPSIRNKLRNPHLSPSLFVGEGQRKKENKTKSPNRVHAYTKGENK